MNTTTNNVLSMLRNAPLYVTMVTISNGVYCSTYRHSDMNSEFLADWRGQLKNVLPLALWLSKQLPTDANIYMAGYNYNNITLYCKGCDKRKALRWCRLNGYNVTLKQGRLLAVVNTVDGEVRFCFH